jgi:hypothetical protein
MTRQDLSTRPFGLIYDPCDGEGNPHVHVQSGTYAPGEVPRYAFCEAVTASGHSSWHIRNVCTRLFLTGGVDTPSLCGHVNPTPGGWDVNVKITEHHLSHACPRCVEAYRKLNP